jgi:hypothetical protein
MELRIAEDMTSILDYLSRLTQGVNGGDWHNICGKAGELVRRPCHCSRTPDVRLNSGRPRRMRRPDRKRSPATHVTTWLAAPSTLLAIDA